LYAARRGAAQRSAAYEIRTDSNHDRFAFATKHYLCKILENKIGLLPFFKENNKIRPFSKATQDVMVKKIN